MKSSLVSRHPSTPEERQRNREVLAESEAQLATLTAAMDARMDQTVTRYLHDLRALADRLGNEADEDAAIRAAVDAVFTESDYLEMYTHRAMLETRVAVLRDTLVEPPTAA